MLKFLKDWTLPIAMVVGGVGYKVMGYLSFLSPILIFCMLLLTFCKISLKDIHFNTNHIWLLLIEIFGAVLIYYIVSPFNEIVAQGMMVCIICPTATAAAVVTGKLHGNVASITTYTLLCNIAVAIAVPLIFPLVTHSENNMSFFEAFWIIICKIFPLLICPFLLAQLMNYFTPKFHDKLANISGLAFYLWAVALALAMGITVKALIEQPADGYTEILLAIGSLFTCALQFFLGKIVGKAYGNTIASGQSLGQKNTILAIWMCNTYLNPLSSLAAGCYVVWQNIFNSWQLYMERKNNP